MKDLLNSRRGRIIAISLLIILAALIYLNRAYARIYDHIGAMALVGTNQQKTWEIVNNKQASSTLSYAALGDSLTAGVGTAKYEESFPYILGEYLAGNDYRVKLTSAAIPGDRTADILKGPLTEAIASSPDVVTVMVGVNDIHGNVGLKAFENNYRTILEKLKAGTRAKIYVISIPYIGSPRLMLPPYQAFFDYQTERYNRALKGLCSEYGADYIDLYSETSDLFKKDGEHYSADFFHPSPTGYKIWADMIYADFNN